jgi:hypothetical protein
MIEMLYTPPRRARTGEPTGRCIMCGAPDGTGQWQLCDKCRREQTQRLAYARADEALHSRAVFSSQKGRIR